MSLEISKNKTVVQEISNYEQCVTHNGLIFAKFMDSSWTSDMFLFGVLKKSILNAI